MIQQIVENSEMIALRIIRGVKKHAHIRMTEWCMTFPAILMWIGLNIQPSMFSVSPSFTALARYANINTWATFLLVCIIIRLAALTINGTFEGFKLSPHFRLAASIAALIFWSQFTLGFITAYLNAEGAFSAIAAYLSFCLFELVNIYRSSGDIGQDIGERLKGRD